MRLIHIFAFTIWWLLIPNLAVVDPATDGTPDYKALYENGVSFDTFLDAATRRRERWHGNYQKGSVPDGVATRLRQIRKNWYLIAVSVDGCSDSVNIIPYLAHFVDASNRLEMRIVTPRAGKEIMQLFLTPDNRGATPTVVLLDDSFTERGVFVERPAALQDWAMKAKTELDQNEFLKQKFEWYDRDLGAQSMEAILDLIDIAEITMNHPDE